MEMLFSKISPAFTVMIIELLRHFLHFAMAYFADRLMALSRMTENGIVQRYPCLDDTF